MEAALSRLRAGPAPGRPPRGRWCGRAWAPPFVSRRDRCRGPCRRGPSWWCSSSRLRVEVRISRRAGRCPCLRRRPGRCACSSAASVGVQAGTVARDQGSVRVHPPLPSGSSPGPSPAARDVCVFIRRSRWGPCRRRRAGRCPCRHRRECGSACSSFASVGIDAGAVAGTDCRVRVHRGLPATGSAVGVDVGAVAGRDGGLGLHPPPPLGSMAPPLSLPARTLVCVFIVFSSSVADQPPCGSQPEPSPAGTVVRTCMGSSPGPWVQPPLGSMKPPSPARSRVVVCMVASLSRRAGRCRRRRPREFRSGSSSFVLFRVPSPPAPHRPGAEREDGHMRQPSESAGAQGSGQPQGSMVERQPARTVVVVFIVVLLALCRRVSPAGRCRSRRRRGCVSGRASSAPGKRVQPLGSMHAV